MTDRTQNERPALPGPEGVGAGRRMTIGEHLDELRRCVVRSLIALVVGCLICIWPARYLLEVLARPVIVALQHHGQPDSFLATSPVETVLMYIKVVLVSGLILASPYVIRQFWLFIAAGLYDNEKKWARTLVPSSIALFLTGVAFMYFIVLFLSLNFLIGFGEWLPLPKAQPNVWERLVIGDDAEGVPETAAPPVFENLVPMLREDPNEPPLGAMWFNLYQNKLKLQGPKGAFSVQFNRDDRRGLVTTHFRLSEYLTFLLVMMVAFGLAFQVPLVVLFLARTGIVPLEKMRQYRKVVLFMIVVIAAMLAPPDLLSHLLLSVPMILLFEIGLLVAARSPREIPQSTDDGGAA